MATVIVTCTTCIYSQSESIQGETNPCSHPAYINNTLAEWSQAYDEHCRLDPEARGSGRHPICSKHTASGLVDHNFDT